MTGRSQVAKVKLCTGAGVCVNDGKLVWTDQSFAGSFFNSAPTSLGLNVAGSYSANYWRAEMADINGDGKSDTLLIHNEADGWKILSSIGNGGGTFQTPVYNLVSSEPFGASYWLAKVGDANGDGLADVFLHHHNSDGWKVAVALSNGDGTFKSYKYQLISNEAFGAGYWANQMADVNGDGLLDIVLLHNEADGWKAVVSLASADGTYSSYKYTLVSNQSFAASYWRQELADVNGDGLSDLVMIHNHTDGWKVAYALGKGDGTFTGYTYTLVSSQDFSASYWGARLSDVNGDGLTDVVMLHHEADGWKVAVSFSTGSGFTNYVYSVVSTEAYGANYWRDDFGDVNGDGLPDAILIHNDTDGWKISVSLSKGDGTYGPANYKLISSDAYGATYWGYKVADVNGDGKSDIVLLHNHEDSWKAVAAQSWFLPTDSVTSLDAAYGAAVQYSYAPLTKGGDLYSKSIVAYPRLAVQSPILVVQSSATANGVGGTRSTEYRYSGLVSELGVAGRGSLGFQWMQTKDVSTGLINRTCFRQDHPYIGMVSQSIQGTSDANWPACGSFKGGAAGVATSNVLSLTTNTYAAKVYSGASTAATDCGDSCTISAGQRYFVYPSQTVTQSWDWDSGTTFIALPQSRTSTTYDNWGNALTIKAETLNPDGSVTGYSKTTTNKYAQENTTNWILGRVTNTTVESAAP